MILSPQDLIDFDYCPRYLHLGGVKESSFDTLIKSIANITLLRYWANRVQNGLNSMDVDFLARSVFAEMVINPHADTVKYLSRMIRKSEDFSVSKVILVGAELSAPVTKGVWVKMTVPFIYEYKGVTTAIYYMVTPGNLFRKQPSLWIARHGFIPNLLFLCEDIKIDRVVLPYYQGTIDLDRGIDSIVNAKSRFDFLATGISRKLIYQRYGPWCSECPLNKNGKCTILRA